MEDNGALMYGPAALSGPISSDAAANVCKALPPVGPAIPDNDQRRMRETEPGCGNRSLVMFPVGVCTYLSRLKQQEYVEWSACSACFLYCAVVELTHTTLYIVSMR